MRLKDGKRIKGYKASARIFSIAILIAIAIVVFICMMDCIL